MPGKPRTDITAFVGRPTSLAVRTARALHPMTRIPDRPFQADEHPQDQIAAVHELPPGAVIVTNSVFVLGEVAGCRVFVAALDAARGRLCARPLTAHPDWPRWGDMLDAGELWSDFSDAWVLADGPDGAGMEWALDQGETPGSSEPVIHSRWHRKALLAEYPEHSFHPVTVLGIVSDYAVVSYPGAEPFCTPLATFAADWVKAPAVS